MINVYFFYFPAFHPLTPLMLFWAMGASHIFIYIYEKSGCQWVDFPVCCIILHVKFFLRNLNELNYFP